MTRKTSLSQDAPPPKFVDLFYDLLLAFLPFVLVSVIPNQLVQVILTAFCLTWFYYRTLALQYQFRNFTYIRSKALNMLFLFMTVVWMNILAQYDLLSQASISVGFGSLALIILLWPLIMHKKDFPIKAPKFTYAASYKWICGSLFVVVAVDLI